MPQEAQATVPTVSVGEDLVLQVIADLEKNGLNTHIRYIKRDIPGATFLDVSRPRNILEKNGLVEKLNYQHFLTRKGRDRLLEISTSTTTRVEEPVPA